MNAQQAKEKLESMVDSPFYGKPITVNELLHAIHCAEIGDPGIEVIGKDGAFTFGWKDSYWNVKIRAKKVASFDIKDCPKTLISVKLK